MKKPNLQTIIVSILIIVALFSSIYLPYKWKQLSNDFLYQTNQYGELLKQINDLEKEVRELKNEDGKADDLKDWKTYNNPEADFTFKYPNNWEIATWELSNYGVHKSIEGEIYGTVLTQFNDWENFEKKEGKITFEKHVGKIKNECLANSNIKNFEDGEILLGEKEAIKFSYELIDRKTSIPGQSGELVSEIYVKTDKGLLYVVGTAVREKETYSFIINQILSTFKFVDQGETDILNWKTYRNEKHGFEFDYPEDLNIKEKVEDVGFDSFSVFLESETFNGYFLFNSPGIATGFDINISTENIIINGKDTKLEILDSSVDNQRATIAQFNKGKDEYFWLFRFDKKDDDKLFLAKNIFSTFKFIE